MKKTYYNFATWLRAFAAILILLCHFTGASDNTYIHMSNEIFRIGVYIFFILSGFLFGTQLKSSNDNVISWYKKRIKRIYIPYELFFGIFAILHLVIRKEKFTIHWFFLCLGMQGTEVNVFGASHTWFITPLLIYYFITPLLALLCVHTKGKHNYYPLLIIFLIFLPFVLALCPPVFISILFSYFTWYGFGYLAGFNIGQIQIKKNYAIMSFLFICILFVLRFVARMFINDTIWYDRIVVQYTSGFAALCICYIFNYLFEDHAVPKFISFFSNISFEIYLYHGLFLHAPLKLFGVTSYWITDCLLATVVSVFVAFIMNKFANFLFILFINKKDEKNGAT